MIFSGWGAAILFLSLSALTISAGPEAGDAPDPRTIELFESRVRPVLVERCFSCHGAEKQRGGLRLDSLPAILRGRDSRPAIVPGDPETSPLILALRHEGKVKMPPREKLPPETIEAFAAWVKLGAPWPGAPARDPRAAAEEAEKGFVEEARRAHWAFQPVQKPPLPAVNSPAWATNEIDLFILAKLEEKGLRPSPPADPRTLVRRASLSLRGLPPTAEEVEAFAADPSREAFALLVDRYLASPAYGERWGRHWLDVARYSDTKGYVFEEERRFPYSYTYRDWVIDAFNRDLPYDRFVKEQIAADHLTSGEDRRPLAALGFLTLGRRFLNNASDIIDDRIDVVSRGFLGLTVTCARCHDHKYDPIPTADYYSLYGVFASSREPREAPLIAAPEETDAYRAFKKELDAREAAVNELLAKKRDEVQAGIRARAGEYLLAATVEKDSDGERSQSPAAGELLNAARRRWRNYLEEAGKSHHPVLAPWLALKGLPEREFAEKAPGVLVALAREGSGASGADPSRRINGLVARAFSEKPPATLRDAAVTYGELLARVEKDWTEALRAAKEAGKEPPMALPGADEEELRQLLYGPKSPVEVPAGEQERFLDRAARGRVRELRKKVEEWKVTSPGAPPRAMALEDEGSPRDARILLRGNPGNPGPEVPRRFLAVLTSGERRPFSKGSGRLELAEAIASPENPLTARVMVNRIWLHHFGAALVRTPGDFGVRSDPPTHPELLDWLAARFVEGGWSVKSMHRLILLSSAWRQSSEGPSSPDGRERAGLDPDNRLLGHAHRRRLDFEALRDSLLAVSGALDPARGGAGVDIVGAAYSKRRTVYGFIDRQNLPGMFRTFDFASPDTTSPQRFSTTVPQQALFLMNSPFLADMARALLSRPECREERSATTLVDRLHRIVLARPATPREMGLALDYLEEESAEPPPPAGQGLGPWERYAQALLLSNEFAFVD